MNRKEFIDYLQDNYSLPVEALRLIYNILLYAEVMVQSDEERYDFLNFVLDGTIGLSEREIRKINL